MSYTFKVSKKRFEEYKRQREALEELFQEDNSNDEQTEQSVLKLALKNFPQLAKTKRKGPYSFYEKAKIRKLFEYYFVDHLTVKEASTVLGIKTRTAYSYIRRLKAMKLPDIFSKRAGLSRDQQLKGLTTQMAALNFY
jgi:Fic family protein